MKAMIWKEWRENAKWAALAFLALSLATIYVTVEGLDGRYSDTSSNPLWMTMPLTTFLVPLFATALGILQVATELRRDQWAFLLHRPVSRSVIFGGKVIAGLSLFLASTLTPILLLAVWMRLPGSLPVPFDWHLLLGPLADILASISFYFAGMLTAIRPARWYGSRALGFVGAVICLMYMNSVTEFWQALLAAIIIGSVLGLAAWGSFLTTGTYDRQPRIAKMALGLSLYTGLVVVVGGLTMFVLSTVSNSQRRADRSNWSVENRSLYGIKGGRVLRITYGEDGSPMTATDLQGHTVPMSQKEFQTVLIRNTIYYSGRYNLDYRSSKRYYLNLASIYQPGIDRTLFFWSSARRVVVVYSKENNREIGSIGPGGFKTVESGGAAPFSEALMYQPSLENNKNLLAFPHSLYALNQTDRTVKKVYSTNSAEGIRSVGSSNQYGSVDLGGADSELGVIGVVEANQIHFLTLKGQLLFGTPLDHQNLDKIGLDVSLDGKRGRIFLWSNSYDNPANLPKGKPLNSVSEFDLKGKLLGYYPLPSLRNKSPEPREYWYETAVPGLEMPPVGMATLLAGTTYAAEKSNETIEKSALDGIRTVLLYSILTSLVLSPLSYRVARRASLSTRTSWGWTVATMLLGVSALLLLLALREWPTLVNCPTCHKKRSVDRDLCEHCGAQFPAPELDDTSIIEERIGEDDLARILEPVSK